MSSHSHSDFAAWFARIVTGKHLWTVIWDAHLKSRISTWFGVHTVQNTVFRILIQDAQLESQFKIRTLPSYENSLSLCKVSMVKRAWYAVTPCIFMDTAIGGPDKDPLITERTYPYSLLRVVVCLAERRERARLAGKLTVWTRVLVPSKRSWTITLPWFKNPFSIANKISGYNLWRQNLVCYEISTNKSNKWWIGDELK